MKALVIYEPIPPGDISGPLLDVEPDRVTARGREIVLLAGSR